MGWIRTRMISVPFTLLLPALALGVWVVAVAVPSVGTYVELRRVIRGGKNATVTVGTYHNTIRPGSFLPFAVNAAVVTRSQALTAMNLPGALVEMPVSVAMTRPWAWYPKELDQWTSSLVAMPLLGLPAWWLVGLGVEALLGRRRLRWPFLALGCVMCGMFVALLCGSVLGSASQEAAGEGWAYAGLGLWIALFALLPAAGVRQWERQRIEGRG